MFFTKKVKSDMDHSDWHYMRTEFMLQIIIMHFAHELQPHNHSLASIID